RVRTGASCRPGLAQVGQPGRRGLPPHSGIARDRLGELSRGRATRPRRRGQRSRRRSRHAEQRRRPASVRRPRRIRVPAVRGAAASASTDTDATPIATYTFDFGDGSPVVGPQSGTTSPHVYTVPGTYTVTLTVADSGGLSSVATAQAAVTDNPPTARMTVQVSG